jgi:hypothetical protein
MISTTSLEATWAIGEGEERMVLRRKPTAVTSALVPAIQQRLLLQVIISEISSSPPSIDKIKSILLPINDSDQKLPDYRIMKHYDPSNVLWGKLTRAAMNIYTSNLNYGITDTSKATEYYTITDPEWKKNYIRSNDGLPSVKQVVQADLDIRDLYRNVVEQKLDDASAELYSTNFDIQEFQSLLQVAAKSFDLWLDRISDDDIKNATKLALSSPSSQNRITVYEPFRAGFVVPSTLPTR